MGKDSDWTEPDLSLWRWSFCPLFPQTQGSSPVKLDLIIPFLKPGSCVLVRNRFLTLHILPQYLLFRWHVGQIQFAEVFGLANMVFEIGISCHHLNIGEFIF